MIAHTQPHTTPLPDLPVADIVRRKERDGCSGCPPWVVRCVHIDDYRIWLWDEQHPDLLDLISRTDHIPASDRWGATEGSLWTGPCCSVNHTVLEALTGPQPDSYEDFNDALADFLAREERYHAERNA